MSPSLLPDPWSVGVPTHTFFASPLVTPDVPSFNPPFTEGTPLSLNHKIYGTDSLGFRRPEKLSQDRTFHRYCSFGGVRRHDHFHEYPCPESYTGRRPLVRNSRRRQEEYWR